MIRVYLAGPINGQNDAQVFGWRAQARQELDRLAVVVDPAERDYRGRELENFERIVEDDKDAIDSCDVLLAHAVTPSVGTSMEVMYAFCSPLRAWDGGRKFVVSVAGERPSPWLLYHSDVVKASLAEALQVIKELARSARRP